MISIVCPTIDAREHWLQRCRDAYHEFTQDYDEGYEFLVYLNRPACGIAWNEGVRDAKGDYIHLTADDIEPTPGWWQHGIEWIEKGYLPAPRILNTDGTLQSCGDDAIECPTGTVTEVARIPFASRAQMECIAPIIDVHYGTDYHFSHEGRKCGYESIVVREFCFYHHFAQEGRVDARFTSDMRDYYKRIGR